MPRRVIVAPRAEAQIQTIDSWWRRNRSDSPDLFTDELTKALSTLEVAPNTGSRYLQSQVKGMRRIPLPADLIGSSQSRVAKMEAGDPSVSVDLLIRTLLALGMNRKQVGRAIGAAACS